MPKSGSILSALLLLLVFLPAMGCSYAQMHGYEVVHSDMRVEYERGPIGFDTTAMTGAGGDAGDAMVREDFSHSVFLEAMRGELATSASHFTLVGASEAPPHTLRLGGLEISDQGDATRVRGDVDIVDAGGRVTSQLRIDVTVPDTGERAATLAGEAFGQRVGHYIENRENYHW